MGRKRCADKRMEQIYKVIKEQLMKKGYPPSVREIGKEVGLKSSSTVHGYLNQLEAAGLIRSLVLLICWRTSLGSVL